MSAAATIERFAQAWGEPDITRRTEHVRAAFAKNFSYTDPRTSDPMTSHDGFAEMLSHYVDSMPDAGVTLRGEVNDRPGCALARLAFVSGDKVMGNGLYYFELDQDNLITKAVGFVDKS